MSRKRVLYVIDSLRRFGATRQLDLLTKILATEFDVHVAGFGSGQYSASHFGARG